MRPSAKTLKILVEMVADMTISEKTVVLYLYYCTCGTDRPTRKEVYAGTGLSLNTVRAHDRLMVHLGLIEKESAKGKKSIITPLNLLRTPTPTTPPDSTSSSSSSSSTSKILDIKSQKDIARKKFLEDIGVYEYVGIRGGSGRGSGQFSEMDISHDEDFLEAKEQLLKFFKPYEIDPRILLKKHRFSKLVDLLEDKSFDFERYCEWYAEHKYSRYGFNFGLFLYPAMIAEFRHFQERGGKDGKYLKSKSVGESENFKSGVKRTKAFLSKLEDDDEG